MEIQQIVASNIQRIRLESGLSQEKLAVDADIARSLVSRLERGVGNPTVAVLARLAEALSVEVIDFLRPPPRQPKVKPLPRGPKGPR